MDPGPRLCRGSQQLGVYRTSMVIPRQIRNADEFRRGTNLARKRAVILESIAMLLLLQSRLLRDVFVIKVFEKGRIFQLREGTLISFPLQYLPCQALPLALDLLAVRLSKDRTPTFRFESVPST
jgi:hypothetical protein